VNAQVLIVDDDDAIRATLRSYLERQHCGVEEAGSLARAEEIVRTCTLDLALLDLRLPDGSALDALPRLRALDLKLPWIILTGHGSIDVAVRAIKEGAEHFLTKPLELATLWTVVQRVLENARVQRKQQIQNSVASRFIPNPFIGTSVEIRRLQESALVVATAHSPILVLGETGTGKGVLARWLHDQGTRGNEPFVELNCAGLSRELLESELFGHEQGAFTGANARKQGLLEIAHRGTVFLDEIGDIDPQIQPKLLKVVEDRKFRPLGQVREKSVNIRLIAATHQDLFELQRDGRFRQDLYFRISTVPLHMPALRDRREDIPLIAAGLLPRIAADLGRKDISLGHDVESALKNYDWPGNIRELRNVLERSALLCKTAQIRASDLRFDGSSEAASSAREERRSSGQTIEENEARHILRVLENEDWKVDRAARRLGIARSSLYNRMKKYGLSKPDPGQAASNSERRGSRD
jgi:DNA-binding NtrC family response regulator